MASIAGQGVRSKGAAQYSAPPSETGSAFMAEDFRRRLQAMQQENDMLRNKAMRAIAAYASVDRGDFILGDSDPYLDAAAVMGFGAQVSAPHVHCAALELARLLQGRGRVVALEHIQELVEEAKQNVAKHHADLMPSSLEILCEDALSLKAEPFDLIHCGAALSQVDDWLLKLLKPNGRVLYVPMTSEGLQRNRGDAWDEVVARCLENSADLT
eukprot:g25417.t1